MTREEAIKILKDCELNPCVSKDKEAANMAIKALEQEPFINKPCVSIEVCKYDKNVVLDKIRTEIESKRAEVSKKHSEDEGLSNYCFGLNDGLKDARDILDKYIAETKG